MMSSPSSDHETWRSRLSKAFFGTQDGCKDETSEEGKIQRQSFESSTAPLPIPSSSTLPTANQSNKLKNFQAMMSTSLEEKKVVYPAEKGKVRVTVRSSDHQRNNSNEDNSLNNQDLKNMRISSPSPRISQETSMRSSLESKPTDESQRQSSSQSDEISSSDDHSRAVEIPDNLQKGDIMLKVTSRKVMQRIVRIDAMAGQILWGSKKNNCVNLESIREVRTGSDARSYRSSLSIASAHEKRWISIIYQTNTIYKALHLIALSNSSFQRWKDTLKAVQEERKMLASSSDMMQKRTSLWLRQQFTSADASKDARLDFDEIVRLCRRLGIMSNREDLRRGFDEADKEGLGYLDFAKFQRFVAVLKRRVEVENLFDQWADGKNDSIKLMSKTAFTNFVRTEQKIINVPEKALDEVFNKFNHGPIETDKGINYDGFLAFLLSSDNAILSDQSSLALAAKADRTSSDSMKVLNSEKRAHAETAEALIAISGQTRVTQDMTRPLSEYFISSSHNTYLVAGQLTGESTVEGYIRALMQGARSVELDCWDGPGNEPVVTHGHTLTSKVPLRDVIQAIGKYAFVASPYPLILSLEVHNDLVQQDAIAEILRTELGKKLLQYPLPLDDSTVLPSPQDLIGKILIKAKNLLLTSKTDEFGQVELVMKERSASSMTDTTTTTTTTTESESDGLLQDLVRSVKSKGRRLSQRRSGGKDEVNANAAGEKKKVMSPALSSLLIYTIGVKHRGINKKETYAIEHMISLSERTAMKYAKSNGEDLIKHNRTHLTRIYPSMNTFARLNYSANFFPNIFWSLGCQLVALNWQTFDLGYEMNQAMFMRNGKSGFVLKPDAFRKKDKQIFSDKLSDESSDHHCFVSVTFTIISAQQLPRVAQGSGKQANNDAGQSKEMDGTVLNPFVSITSFVPDTPLFNVSTFRNDHNALKSLDKRTNSFASSNTSLNPVKARKHSSRARTLTIWRNGFNPIWNETITFRLQIPIHPGKEEDIQESLRGLLDLCFVRFEVRSQQGESETASSPDPSRTPFEQDFLDDSPCLATYMISLGAMEQGYHHIPLYDSSMTQLLFSTLFVRTSMEIDG